VSITGAANKAGADAHACQGPVTLVFRAEPAPQPVDLSGGQPFTPPNGTFTIPQVPAGDYAVTVVCAESGELIGMDGFGFRVTSAAIVAAPNLAG
jgi:hypothetical protein